MDFNKVLNEVRISKFVQLYRKNDPRINDRKMVANLSDDEGQPITSGDAESRLKKMGVTISPELKTLIRDLTAEANAKTDFNQQNTERNKALRGKMKGGTITKSRYGMAT